MTNSTRCALLAKQACTTLSHVVQKITPPSANNFLKLFFALFAMLALNVGNAWAETVVLDQESLTTSKQAYVKTDYTHTATDGSEWVLNGYGIITTNPRHIQLGKASKNYIKTPNCSGNITNVSITFAKACSYYIAVWDLDGTKASSTVASKPAANSTINFAITGEHKQLQIISTRTTDGTSITTSNAAAYIASITVTYETSSGGETPDPTPSKLSTPANLKEASIAETSATLSWDAVANASNYSVTINGNTETVTTNSYSATGLTAGTEYTWSVVAKGDGTNYTDSDAAQHTFTTTATTPEPGTGTSVTYDFTKIEDFKDWPTSYASGKGDVVYTEATVKFTGAVKQTQTITDCPVTKGGEVQLVLNSGYSNRDITNVTFVCRQWGSKTQTITLHYSTDGGANYTKTEITSTNFTISFDNLPEGTNAVKITFSSSSNQVGIESVTFSLSSDDEPGTEEPVASLTTDPTSLDFGNVTQNNEVEAKTFTISGSDFTTGELTITAPSGYTVNPTTVSVDGTLGETTITVTPNTSTVGTFNGNVTISGANLKSNVNVALTMTVEKAPATPTENVYVKVTSTAGITDGEYLIVYEDAASETPAPVAFDGSLATLDAVSNNIAVTITDGTIAGNTDIDAATFTIDATEGTIKSASGNYIGVTSYNNGLKQSTDVSTYGKHSFVISEGNAIVKLSNEGWEGDMILRYNSSSNNGYRFRYYKSGQQPIALYKKVDPNEVVAPAFTLTTGEYYGTQSVMITCATTDAKIYYTLDGNDPTDTSDEYTGGAITISETKTLKAIAIKGENKSEIAEATYTILAPLATMQEIYDKATVVGETATPVHITMNKWVVTGVKNNNVYVTDGTKGLIIYTASHGFNVGDILSGTVACKVQLYNGSSELTELTSTTEGLTVTTGGVVTPVEVADKSTLSGVNTGAVILITGVCETKTNNDKLYYYVGGIQLFNSLFTYDTPTVGGKYNVTGVYLQYNEIPEILPRSAADIEEIIDLPTATISIADITMEVGQEKTIEATITPEAALSAVQYSVTSGNEYITLNGTTITAVDPGEATITATIAEVAGQYYGTDKTFTVTVKPQNIAELPFEFTGGKADIENTLGMSQEGLGSDYTTAGVTTKLKFDNKSDCVIIHFNGQAEKLAYDIKGNGFSGGTFSVQESADGETYTDVVAHTELGDAATTKEHELAAESRYVKFIYTEKSSGNVGLGNIKITKLDTRKEAGLAWNHATVSLTVGDAFTAPTLSNPYSVSGITYESSNDEVATVTAEGEIALASAIGTATITATFAGDATYKPAEVKCTISVNPKTENIVILAQYAGNWYALKAEYVTDKTDRLVALPVEYINGTLYNVADADKALITWERVVIGDKATFKNGDNYLKGGTSTDLTLKTEVFEWDYNGELETYLSDDDTRTFFYHKDGIFRNYSITNASNGIATDVAYSALPVVTAAKFETATIYTRSELPVGNYGTICLPYGSSNFTGAEFYEVAGKEGNKVVLDQVTTLEDGIPYIFKATANELKVVCEGEAADDASNNNGLYGTFTDNTPVAEGMYIVYDNQLRKCGTECIINANRAYLNLEDVNNGVPAQMPGRKRVGMAVTGENGTTDLDNIVTPNGKATKVLYNGQIIIIRNGEKFNAQGQKL